MSDFATIEQAIEDIKSGKMLVVVDDEDRENEGDIIVAAETLTPEHMNFMATHARGLICTPIVGSRPDELEIGQMVAGPYTHLTLPTVRAVQCRASAGACTKTG